MTPSITDFSSTPYYTAELEIVYSTTHSIKWIFRHSSIIQIAQFIDYSKLNMFMTHANPQ